MRDVRCGNAFKGKLHGWCGQLIMRISQESHGTVEHRCPRCKDTRITRIDTPAINFAST